MISMQYQNQTGSLFMMPEKVRVYQARALLQALITQSPSQTDEIISLPTAAETLQAFLEHFRLLLQADAASLVMYDTVGHAPLLDLTSRECPALCRTYHHQKPEQQTATSNRNSEHSACVSFFKHQEKVGTLCLCRVAGFSDDDLRVLSDSLSHIATTALVDHHWLNQQHEHVYDRVLDSWMQILATQHKETREHIQRVTDMTVALAGACGVDALELVHIRRGALLHDIGKIAVPDHILCKSWPLTQEEQALLRQHPHYASEMLAHIPFLQPALAIPLAHHERWDGSGYPEGLRGEQIPLAARIFALVDIWDTMYVEHPSLSTCTEPCRRAYIEHMAGSQFDPEIVPIFLQQLDSMPHIFL
jgi:HD-GYP domain-containing protein (c-di-GMP phosphodiesterase class II)